MTPLLPSPKHYLQNLITMTSSDSKRLWRRAVKEHFKCTCVYCGETYEFKELTLDHVKPRSRGGQDLTTNVVCACRKCNQDKGSRNWLHWMRDRFGHRPIREQTISDHIAA
jgi:5-methylcytosine-specific restriction endonuclease McrA